MQVGITYADREQQLWLNIDIPTGSTVEDVIRLSGILTRFPHIDLANQKVGIFGKVVTLDRPVAEGDRVEIYRPITADPKKVKRRRKPSQNDT